MNALCTVTQSRNWKFPDWKLGIFPGYIRMPIAFMSSVAFMLWQTPSVSA